MSKRKDPKYRHHKARGLARVDIDGVAHYLGAYGSAESHEKYAKLIREWRARQDAADAGLPSPPPMPDRPRTVADLLVRWWIHAEQHYCRPDGSAKRELTSFLYALRPLEVLHGATAVEAFGPKALKEYRLALAQGWMDPVRGLQRGLARKVVNRHVVRVRTAFRWAEEEELVPGGTFHRLQAVKGWRRLEGPARETPKVRPVAEEMIEAALKYLNPIPAAIVRVQLLTAARPGELLGLRVGAVQRGRDKVEIDGALVDAGGLWAAVLEEHKTAHTGAVRMLLFGPQAQAILGPLIEGRAPEEFVFRPGDALTDLRHRQRAARKTKVQPSQVDRRKKSPKRKPGRHYAEGSYRRAITQALLHAMPAHPPLGPQPGEGRLKWRQRLGPTGLKELAAWMKRAGYWHPNQLRHNAITRLGSEFSPEVARIVAGHAGLETTRNYLVDDIRKAAEAMRQVG